MTRETERMTKALENMGFTITEVTETPGHDLVMASRAADQKIAICWGSNGTAVVTKPNGTRRWYYEKTIPQICQAIQQTMNYYK